MCLDRFLTRRGVHPCKEVSRLLADGWVRVDSLVEINGLCRISRVELDGKILQEKEAVYLMLHKPAGYLSATSDPQHPTVMELIDHPLETSCTSSAYSTGSCSARRSADSNARPHRESTV